ncbi:MAG: type II toxin-antitoxin system HicA family toxin [Candidatus Dormibacteria bacterium]
MRILEANGFVSRGGTKHDVFMKPGVKRPVVVPRHSGDLPKGTVASIWRQAGIKPD